MNEVIFENQLDEKTKLLISQMEKKLNLKDKEIKSKEYEINDLKK